MIRYVLDLREAAVTDAALVGGKGAALGTLARLSGVQVPPGFCVTAEAYGLAVAAASGIGERLHKLSRVDPGDRSGIRTLSQAIRRAIEQADVPAPVVAAITQSCGALGEGVACAVRSSATAEDMPSASFAGQYDSYLNVVGTAAVLRHVRRCWASLFTERAVSYRLRQGFDHQQVRMAVVVQKMVAPRAAGVLFTADPATGNRRVCVIEGSFGLGDTLVSGRINASVYHVRNEQVVAHAEVHHQPVLTEQQALQLAQLGRHIEAHMGRPQDIEWCLAHNGFHVVQARPITTLFPIPGAADDANRVYVSVGHQQMMTDAMKTLGLSFWQRTSGRPMVEAGGRLFVDVTHALASPSSRAGVMALLGRSDPLIGSALQDLLDRDDFLTTPTEAGPEGLHSSDAASALDPDTTIVAELVQRQESAIAALQHDVRGVSGLKLLDLIDRDVRELKQFLFDPLSLQVIMAGMHASWWLNDRMLEWLGEVSVADVLTRSVPGNVTSEMGLALLDVADAIRPHAEVVAFLQQVQDDHFMNRLPAVPGGAHPHAAIQAWLARYGMRGPGEIDISRPRWAERPGMLLPILLGYVRNLEPGAAGLRFQQGQREAAQKEQELLARLRTLPSGEEKAAETKRMIQRVRVFAGYREYPKYAWMNHYYAYRQALLGEAARLASAGILPEPDDIFFLTFDELRTVVRTQHADQRLLRERARAFQHHQSLTPPRVITSEGEVLTGTYRRKGTPAGVLVGLPVSSGVVEGRARVVFNMDEADFAEGDILVTVFTDPSWTPAFLGIRGLVTEVGGLMTHGAVVAREYGLPAVVGVQHATTLIRDGQHIRVDGANGYVSVIG